MMPQTIPISLRLQCSLAAAITDPSSLVAPDLLGIAPWSPRRVEALRKGPQGRRFEHALAVDLGLVDLASGETLAMGLRTREDVRLALRMSIAPTAEIRTGVRQLAATVFRKTIGRAVRRADRQLLSEFLGEDALLTAARQAETFWPSLAVFDALDTALLARPDEPVRDKEATAEGGREPAWTRPTLAREIETLPALLRHAWGILHACVDGIDKTSGVLLRARFGSALAGLVPAAGPKGSSAEELLSASQRTVIFNLLQRKVPAWSTSID